MSLKNSFWWHTLRNTLNSLRAIESSLGLEGKAYKWYMSLNMAARTSIWSRYQEIFWKEFLPKNDQDRNWGEWDVCQMGSLTLTKYIFKYRSVILKLDGLDNFQKVRRFFRGLNKDYKSKLKSQYPKTLEQAIKDAQVYDDNTNKPSHAHAQGKNNASNNTNKKCKPPYVQGHKGDNNKKSKGT